MDKVSFKKVMKYDGLFRMIWINGVLFAGIGIYFYVTKKSADGFEYIFYAVAILALGLLIWRYFYLSSFGVNLSKTDATIIRVFYNRGVKTLTCNYIVDDILYKKRYALNYTKATREYHKEDIVEIVYKQSHPKQSLIKNLYFDEY